METPKLGRCECRRENCEANHFSGPVPESFSGRLAGPVHCKNDAVRTVTVRRHYDLAGTESIPMCAACAEFHESRVAK